MSLEHDFNRQMTLFTVLMGIQVVWLAVPHGSYYEGFPAAALLLVIPWRLWRRGLPAYRCSIALEVLTLVWVVPVAAISAFPSVVVVLLVTAVLAGLRLALLGSLPVRDGIAMRASTV
jgi:hypothetical protein